MQHSAFWIRLLNWEYWPMHLVYTPVYLYYLFLSLRARAFVFFSAANPGIDMGGLLGESKYDILQKIPSTYIPKTLYLSKELSHGEVISALEKTTISFPLILKPDVGERGFMVEKIRDEVELADYRRSVPATLLAQEYVHYQEEVSVLYYRYPEQKHGVISSLTLKEFLHVEGDGKRNLEELILDYPRALLQYETLKERFHDRLEEIPPKGKKVDLVAIGNHSRGTKFLNGNHLIDEQLRATFDHISHQIDGIYFGRFDIRCESLESLKKGERFKILEINGVKSEPTHIYDPDFSLWEAYKVLFKQWNTIYEISQQNRQKGVPVIGSREAFKRMIEVFKYKKDTREFAGNMG